MIYAILTEGNMATMFQATFIADFLATLGYMLAISAYVRLRPRERPGRASHFDGSEA